MNSARQKVWDLHPGFFSSDDLEEERRLLKGLLEQESNEKLAWRYALVIGELWLRHGCSSELPGIEISQLSHSQVDEPPKQMQKLRKRYAGRQAGRMPLPTSCHQLWAQHKYSVMARNPNRYRELGRIVAGNRCSEIENRVLNELCFWLQQKPSPGRLFNALQHMWGYVSEGLGSFACENETSLGFIREIAVRAIAFNQAYLLNSTALSELAIWLPTQEVRDN